MKQINIIFDGDLDDVDILIVPDYIADSIENITQQFFDWVANTQNSKMWTSPIQTGNVVLSVGTEEFLWWINNILIPGEGHAEIYREHTRFQPEYPSAEF